MKKKATYHVIFAFVFVLVSINLSGCKNGPDKSKLEEERKALILSKRMPRYMGKCRNLTEEEKKSEKMKARNLHFALRFSRKSLNLKISTKLLPMQNKY
jgi:hypothetical protein